MNEAQFEEFIARCVASAQQKNDALDAKHGLHSFTRWDDDTDRQILLFTNPGEADALEAKVTPIGSYSLKTQTWLWAWANESLTEDARQKASKLKNLSDRTGMRVFVDAHVDCDEYLAWELAAAAVDELGSLGCYREPVGHLWIFVSIDAVAAVRRAI
jgi:hypothetical protein